MEQGFGRLSLAAASAAQSAANVVQAGTKELTSKVPYLFIKYSHILVVLHCYYFYYLIHIYAFAY